MRKSVFVVVAAAATAVVSLAAQDRIAGMPGYQHFVDMQQKLQGGAFVSGAAASITWAADGGSFTYDAAGHAYAFDLATMKATETGDAPAAGRGFGRGARGAGRGATPPARGQQAQAGRQGQAPPTGGRAGGLEQEQNEMPALPMDGCPQSGPARGRQVDCVISPDGKLKAFYRARNLWIANVDGSNEKAITTDGSVQQRIKYGTASWVYGEELAQTTAIWWSPDSTRVGYYRFDESQVKDYYLAMQQTSVEDAPDAEAYPLPGEANPIADVFVYDVASAKRTHIDARDGKPFTNDVMGYYVYDVQWSHDGRSLLFNRTNRRQQDLDFVACSPSTGGCRVVLHEAWHTGWLNTYLSSEPAMTPRWLADGHHFIWASERNGWINYYLYDLDGTLVAPLTHNTTFDSANIVKLDEAHHVMFYMARDGDNYMKLQLHRVNLDGTGDVRLTDPAFTHSVGSCDTGGGGRGGRGGFGGGQNCGISPDNTHIVDVYQTHDQAPATELLDGGGKVLAQLAKSDTSRMDALGFKRAELFTYKAADGQTTLYGEVYFPSDFDASKQYPTLVPVYGGPVLQSSIPSENFAQPNLTCEYGFLVVEVSYRGVPGLGKRAADALYMKLGQTEMDDMANGVKALWSRPYFDKARVGIYGTSYGGYTSAMQIVRHPEVFAAASASSPPTDWHNYDSIYTERYMWIPEENAAGYEAGSVMTYAKDLRGRLLLYYGTADNNVHPSNTLQLVQALQRAGKDFELQVGPDMGHSGVNNQRMMEFFIENLVMHPERLEAPVGGGRQP